LTDTQYYGTGRRKTSTARVYLRNGSGAATINGRSMDVYFPNDVLKMVIRQPLLATENHEKFDLFVTVEGGGPAGQAGAIRHGIARALAEFNPDLRKPLRDAGFLTRDPREKERQKYGQRGARARYQFSKR
jgi:small subunit ribosomal protein S9